MTPALSSLRNRFFLALGGVLCLALLALMLIARYQITPILVEDEDTYAKAELNHAERALDNELGHMVRLIEDWAWWDDTYQFVQGKRPEYIESNLYASTLTSLELSMMVFFSEDDQPYRVAGINADQDFTSCPGVEAPCEWTDEIVSVLQEKIEDGLEEDSHAWLMASPTLAMVGLSPIYMSQADAPPSGWLAMVRPLSASWINQLRETTGIDMGLRSVTHLESSPNDSLERVSATQMQANRDLAALPSSHRVRIDAALPRQRYQASLETFRFAMYWTSGVLIMTMIVVLLLLERMILAPMRQFSQYTQRLRHEDRQVAAPPALLKRRDEIGMLVREFMDLYAHEQQQKQLLLDLSQHDPLTGLANRRLFDVKLAHALSNDSQEGNDVSVLMVDIDHFKQYNDHYGHQQGDACLITLAERMDECLGQWGFLVARTGGEEFSVVLPGTPLENALRHAETLRQAITDLSLPHAASPTAGNVTISIGASTLTSSTQDDPGALMRAADLALYQAKKEGRNRVESHIGEREDSESI